MARRTACWLPEHSSTSVAPAGSYGVSRLLRCRDRLESAGAGQLSTVGRALDGNHVVPRGLRQLGHKVAHWTETDHGDRVTWVRSAELQADAADLAEAGKGCDVESEPGRYRHTEVVTGVEPHHALMRGVRENVRPDFEFTVKPGGEDRSGHGIARMERLARTRDGREPSDKRVSTVVGKLGTWAYDATAGLHDDLVRANVA